MVDTASVVKALSEIAEDALLGPSVAAVDAAYDAIGMLDLEGIALRAPRSVKLASGELPALLVAGLPRARLVSVPLPDHACFVCRRLDRAGTWIGPAFPRHPTKNETPAELPPPDELPTKVTVAERFELRGLLGLPAEPARYAIDLVAFDWITNTVVATVEADQGSPPPADAFFSLERAAELAARVRDAKPGSSPRFPRGPASPALRGLGVALDVPARAGKHGPVTVKGSFRITASAGHLVEPALPGRLASEKDLPVAVVEVALVLAAPRLSNPKRVLLSVPIFYSEKLPKTVKAGDTLAGAFELDLDRQDVRPGSYQAYVFVDEHKDGPKPLEVEAEERTR